MRVLRLTTEFPPVILGGLGSSVGVLVDAPADAGTDVGVLLVGRGISGYATARRPIRAASAPPPASVSPNASTSFPRPGPRRTTAPWPFAGSSSPTWLWPTVVPTVHAIYTQATSTDVVVIAA